VATKEKDVAAKQKDLTAKQKEIDDLKKDLAKVKVTPGDKAASQKLQKDVTERGSLISSIDAFLAALNGTPQPANNQPATTKDTTPTKDTGTSNASSTPPLAAVLAADGLARAIGVNTDGDLSIPGWHLLWLKALESGGTMLTKSNLLGSKVYFSGGAVSTYALFELNGQLSCSGNLYDYSGNIREKNFQKRFRKPNIGPENQLIFFRSRCSTPEPPPSPISQSGSGELLSGDPLAVDPTSLDFPTRSVGGSVKLTLKVKNNKDYAVGFSATIDKDDFSVTTDCGDPTPKVGPNETCVLTVTFTPKTEGKKQAVLRIQPNGPAITVPLGGTATAKAAP
jgi:hypothetical protein